MPITLQKARVPDGVCIYAVGDVHGRHDLLIKLFARIEADAATAPEPQKELIFLGDYMDRGLYSRQTLDWLIGFNHPNFHLTCLKGNHEDMLLKFLATPSAGQAWMECGAYETLLSFGLRVSSPRPKPETFKHLAEQLHLKLQGKYLKFLNSCPLGRTVGDYFFTHAGIDPDKPINKQKSADLLWIRDKFLGSDKLFEKVIVHGHTISPLPEVRPNRIGIDTGAYGTGRLTCAVLYGNQRHFLHTA